MKVAGDKKRTNWESAGINIEPIGKADAFSKIQ